MIAQQHYFEQVKLFVEVIIPQWDAEIVELDNYIEKVKAEGKSITHLQIRKNKALQRIEAIEKLIEAASIAVSTTPTKSNTNNDYATSETQRHKRQRLCDMDEGNEWRIKRILAILENEFNY